jgi:hypothetical protein
VLLIVDAGELHSDEDGSRAAAELDEAFERGAGHRRGIAVPFGSVIRGSTRNPAPSGVALAATHATIAVRMGIPQSKEPVVEALERSTIKITAVAGKGRGVIAARKIMKGELVERAPVVVVPVEQRACLERTVLDHYVYDWSDGRLAVALGAGSIFNHSYTPNATYAKRFDEHVLEYTALVDIEAGDEIVINYNGDPRDLTPLWFAVVD